MLYGSGLRVLEAVYLDYCDISRTNMTVHVGKSKSRIDIYTILSQKSLDILTEYWFAYNKPMEAFVIFLSLESKYIFVPISAGAYQSISPSQKDILLVLV